MVRRSGSANQTSLNSLSRLLTPRKIRRSNRYRGQRVRIERRADHRLNQRCAASRIGSISTRLAAMESSGITVRAGRTRQRGAATGQAGGQSAVPRLPRRVCCGNAKIDANAPFRTSAESRASFHFHQELVRPATNAATFSETEIVR